MKFKIRTSVPTGRNTWGPDTAAKVQADLFAVTAMLAAASEDAERMFMDALSTAKLNKAAVRA